MTCRGRRTGETPGVSAPKAQGAPPCCRCKLRSRCPMDFCAGGFSAISSSGTVPQESRDHSIELSRVFQPPWAPGGFGDVLVHHPHGHACVSLALSVIGRPALTGSGCSRSRNRSRRPVSAAKGQTAQTATYRGKPGSQRALVCHSRHTPPFPPPRERETWRRSSAEGCAAHATSIRAGSPAGGAVQGRA